MGDKVIDVFGVVFLLIVVAVVIGATTIAGIRSLGNEGGLPAGVTRFVDEEAGVACWVYADKMSCLPVSETRLDK